MGNINTSDITNNIGVIVGHNNVQNIIIYGQTVDPRDLLIPRKHWKLDTFIGREREQQQSQALYAEVAQPPTEHGRRGQCCYLTGKLGFGGNEVARAAVEALTIRDSQPIVVDLTAGQVVQLDSGDTKSPLARYFREVYTALPPEIARSVEPTLTSFVVQLVVQSPAAQRALALVSAQNVLLSLRSLLRAAAEERSVILLTELGSSTSLLWTEFLDEVITQHVADLSVLVLATLETRQPLVEEGVADVLEAQAQRHVRDGLAMELRLPNLTEDEITATLDGNYQLGELLFRDTSGWPALTDALWQQWRILDYVEQLSDGFWELTTPGRQVMWSVYTDLLNTFFEQPWNAWKERPFDFKVLRRLLTLGALEGMEFTPTAAVLALKRMLKDEYATHQIMQGLEEHTVDLLQPCEPLVMSDDERLPRYRFRQEWVRLKLLHDLHGPNSPYTFEQLALEVTTALAAVGGLRHPVTIHTLFDLYVALDDLGGANKCIAAARTVHEHETLLHQATFLKQALARSGEVPSDGGLPAMNLTNCGVASGSG